MSEGIFDNLEDAMFEFIFQDKLNLIRLRKRKDADDSNIKYELPSEKGIIIRTTFVVNDDGRRFPNKAFYFYDPDSFSVKDDKVDKRTISTYLKDSLVSYITNNNAINDNFLLMEKAIVKKNNSVKYELKFSDFVSFNIVISPKDLDVEDVSGFVTGLRIDAINEYGGVGVKKGGEGSDPWKVELAKSSRATCKSCGQKIMKETIRLGEPSYYEGHISYKWNHLTCIRKFDESTPLTGLDDLSKDLQDQVNQHLFKNTGEQGISTEVKDPKEAISDIILEFEDADGLTAESDIYKTAKDRYNFGSEKVKEILEKMEEEGEIYKPDIGKIKIL